VGPMELVNDQISTKTTCYGKRTEGCGVDCHSR